MLRGSRSSAAEPASAFLQLIDELLIAGHQESRGLGLQKLAAARWQPAWATMTEADAINLAIAETRANRLLRPKIRGRHNANQTKEN